MCVYLSIDGVLSAIEKVAEILAKKGYEAKPHQLLIGSSGITHKIDVLAVKGKEKFIIEVLRRDLEAEVISTYAKMIDLRIDKGVVIVVGKRKINRRERELAEKLGVKIIDFSEFKRKF